MPAFLRFLAFVVLLGASGIGGLVATWLTTGRGHGIACFALPISLAFGLGAWRVTAFLSGLGRAVAGRGPPRRGSGAWVFVPFGLFGGVITGLLVGPSWPAVVVLSLVGLAFAVMASVAAYAGAIEPESIDDGSGS